MHFAFSYLKRSPFLDLLRLFLEHLKTSKRNLHESTRFAYFITSGETYSALDISQLLAELACLKACMGKAIPSPSSRESTCLQDFLRKTLYCCLLTSFQMLD